MAKKPTENKVGAPQGNTNAEKWGEKEVLAELAEIEAEARKADCLWLGSALVARGLYKDIWRHWNKRYKRNAIVLRAIKRIDQIFEDKLYRGGLNGKHNATITIFGLKNNHGWVDKTETDITTGGNPLPSTVNLANATDEHLEKLAGILTDIGGSSTGTGKA